jgi:flagellar protein FlaG
MRITSMDASIVMPMPIREMDGTNGADTNAKTECEMRVSGRASINVMFGLEPDKAEMTVSEKIVYQAIERANEAILVANRRFEYTIHEKTKEIMVKVIDAETNEVIREIPPEKILDLVATIWEMMGLIIDEKR